MNSLGRQGGSCGGCKAMGEVGVGAGRDAAEVRAWQSGGALPPLQSPVKRPAGARMWTNIC